jgi:pilus assembly protein CpaF
MVGESAAPATPNQKLLEAKVRLHKRLIEELNLSAFEKLPEQELRREIHAIISGWVKSERLALNTQELNNFVAEVMDEMTGLGPLEPLLKDPSIADILINGPPEHFSSSAAACSSPCPPSSRTRRTSCASSRRSSRRSAGASTSRARSATPASSTGSRFNCAVRPIGVDGPLVSIRKFSKSKLSLDKLSRSARSARRWRRCSPPPSRRASPRSCRAARARARPRC